jgi:outer membrane protein
MPPKFAERVLVQQQNPFCSVVFFKSALMSFRSAFVSAGLVVLAVVAPATAMAQEFRIGFVNTERIFREANAAKAAQAKLETEFAKREAEIVASGNTLKTAAERYERERPTLSESQRQTRERGLAEQERDVQRKRREFQEDLNARKNEELQAVLERANRMVRQVAEAEKYDLVLQEAVYIAPKHDITEKVIAALNAAK